MSSTKMNLIFPKEFQKIHLPFVEQKDGMIWRSNTSASSSVAAKHCTMRHPNRNRENCLPRIKCNAWLFYILFYLSLLDTVISPLLLYAQPFPNIHVSVTHDPRNTTTLLPTNRLWIRRHVLHTLLYAKIVWEKKFSLE